MRNKQLPKLLATVGFALGSAVILTPAAVCMVVVGWLRPWQAVTAVIFWAAASTVVAERLVSQR